MANHGHTDFSGLDLLSGKGGTKIIERVDIVDNTIDGKNVDQWADIAGSWYNKFKKLEKEIEGMDTAKSEKEKLEIQQKAISVGMRAVIRECLNELRKTQPNHPLLDKKVRDNVYRSFFDHELKKFASEMERLKNVKTPLDNQVIDL
jgi:hypothetical protein